MSSDAKLAWGVIVCTLDDPDDPAARWTPLDKLNVPRVIQNPEVISRMRSGEIVKAHVASPLWYRWVATGQPQPKEPALEA